MSGHASRSGFALLLTLMLVLVAGVALAGVARTSMVEALDTQEAVEELQRRWAVTSCQSTLLWRAEMLLGDAERGEASEQQENDPSERGLSHPPIAELRVNCRLAGIDYELVFTDEQSKLNPDAMMDWASPEEVRSAVTGVIDVMGPTDAASLRVKLRAMATDAVSEDEMDGPLTVGGYGQVFGDASPRMLIGNQPEGGAARLVTCWGDGKLNIRRAPAPVVKLVCEPALGGRGVGALLAARDHDPYRDMALILAELDEIDIEQKAVLESLLTDQSACHGLWVIARGPTRSWYSLAVRAKLPRMAEDPAGGTIQQAITRQYDFSW